MIQVGDTFKAIVIKSGHSKRLCGREGTGRAAHGRTFVADKVNNVAIYSEKAQNRKMFTWIFCRTMFSFEKVGV